MASVFYLTPWKEGDIGGGINESIALLPADAWICLRDADTLFLTPDVQKQIAELAAANPEFDLIGCRTNRLRSDYQVLERERLFDCDSITTHVETAKYMAANNWGVLTPLPAPEVVAGMFMLFRKSLWEKIKFPRHSIYFDSEFTKAVRIIGGKVALAQGIYLFHLYRWGQDNPYAYTNHLI
ncbi:hypothetical protein ACJVQT_22880 [Enterobacter huaxiensis]|uniref:hypothetical protein n=1 Tax=Enterobacter huaxiensis TaxID=2494702 RepID=UPI002175BB01|nr:hypothetical protein [Enterobacter huaxiensis]MCS5452512.1 hypothetical protein [Enterobacter huaxiensis]